MKILTFTLLMGLALMPGVHARAAVEADSTDMRQSLLDAVAPTAHIRSHLTVDLNTRFALHAALTGAEDGKASFRADFVRLQITGDVTERVFFKWFQRLNVSHTPCSLDNLPSSMDCLGVGFHIRPNLTAFVGKQYADFGGFEYDADPAEVYEFSDYGNYMTCFLVGANVIWAVSPQHELRFQITDGRNHAAEEAFSPFPADYRGAKVPLNYTVNWNGTLLNNRLLTRCSFSFIHEGEEANTYFLALGAAWQQNKFHAYADALYSIEDIDKLGVLSEISTRQPEGCRAEDCEYLSLIARVNYRPAPKLNIFVKGTYETSSIRHSGNGMEEGKQRTAGGYQGGVEYFPTGENLRFFLHYHGKQVDFPPRASALGATDFHTHSLSVGLVYKIPVI